MKNIIEALGLTVTELVGAALVFSGLGAAIVLFHTFGDLFISYFL